MRRGARNADGQVSLPGIGRLPARLRRQKGARRPPDETALSAALQAWSELPANRERMHLDRSNAGIAFLRGGGALRLMREGTADRIGSARGREIAVEVKVSPRKLTDPQRAYLLDVVARGGWAFVCRDTVESFALAFAAAEAGRYSAPRELFP